MCGQDWSYCSELSNGSYTIEHINGYDNPYSTEPFTTHTGPDEIATLKARVAELEKQLAAK